MYVFGEWLVFIKLCIGFFFNIILCPVPVHSEYTYIPAMVTPNSKNAPPPSDKVFHKLQLVQSSLGYVEKCLET